MATKDWSKWGWEFWTSLARHIGTAGMAWVGASATTGGVSWKTLETLPLALLFGAVIPTLFTFLQNNPVPPDEEPETKT